MVWRVTACGAGVGAGFAAMGLCATDFSRSANSNSPDHAVPATTGIRFNARGVLSCVVEQAVPRASNAGTSNWRVSNDLASNGLGCGCWRGFVVMGLGATDLVSRLLRRHSRKATAGAGWLWVVPRDVAWCWMVAGQHVTDRQAGQASALR